MTDITKLTDKELSDAIRDTKDSDPMSDALMREFYKRHKEKMSKKPIGERRRNSYEKFVLHEDDIV